MGACLLLRPKSRRSARPAFRSRASLLAQPSEGVGTAGRFFFVPERDSEALARAPKEIDSAASGSDSSSSEDEGFDYIVVRIGFV